VSRRFILRSISSIIADRLADLLKYSGGKLGNVLEALAALDPCACAMRIKAGAEATFDSGALCAFTRPALSATSVPSLRKLRLREDAVGFWTEEDLFKYLRRSFILELDSKRELLSAFLGNLRAAAHFQPLVAFRSVAVLDAFGFGTVFEH